MAEALVFDPATEVTYTTFDPNSGILNGALKRK